MQLTQFTDYSLRTLIYVATKQETCTINDIAEAYGIKKNHLTKIVHHLSKLGIIQTSRGRNGGIEMAVEPESVNLKALLIQLESHLDLVPCFNQNKQNCRIAPDCKLKHILNEAKGAFLNVLNNYTLAEVVSNGHELKALLGIPSET